MILLQRLYTGWLLLLTLGVCGQAKAQTILTDVLPVTAVCPGSPLDVQFSTDSQYNADNAFVVEISDGVSGYKPLITGRAKVVFTNRVSAIWHVTATMPTSATAGVAYRVRVTASSPAVTGIPSSSTLTVKNKPATPSVNALQLDCQRRTADDAVSAVYLKIVAGATPRIYDSNSTFIQEGNTASSDPAKLTVYFQLPKAVANADSGFRYPIRETTYYLTQVVDGCESDKAPTVLRTVYRPASGPKPVNASDTNVGKVTYCQGENAVALNVNGHAAPPDNYRTRYSFEGAAGGSTTTPPIPDTKNAGSLVYTLGLSPIDSTKGCPTAPSTETFLVVQVNPRPAKPTVPASALTVCQFETTGPLSAATTENGASLVWYGTKATGGVGSLTATQPSTDSTGTVNYYVVQRLNECESERVAITVTVTGISATPGVSSVSYCQGVQAVPLAATAATGSSLTWYTAPTGGTGAGVAPTPETNNAGVQTFYVTQTSAGRCESKRAPITVSVTALPGAPAIPSPVYVACQNDTTQTLSATGQNLTWYLTSSGGTGTVVRPKINTSQAGQLNYYVSQTIAGCEGPRASLSVTVKPLPAAPVVSALTLCQFATATPVSATGQNLKWYNLDGNPFPITPTPITDKVASFSYAVTQTIDGCEGPKAILAVSVQTTPVPTVTQSIVELCQGAIAQPLEAVGSNLRWTDPNGVVTTTAPTPATNKASNKQGDVYYVTQTGATGCESPKVAIRVFVQSPPTLSLVGSTTVNLGLDVPITLTFTGVGPYQYKLSNGLSGTAVQDTTIRVLPDRTTTYQVAQVSNKCGAGVVGDAAVITVTIPVIQTLPVTSATLCAGSNLTANFLTKGTFNPGSVFKLQLAKVETDTTKASFTDVLATQVSAGQLVGVIPGNTVAGTYWVRVVATNPKIPINGTISATVLTIRSLPTATLTGNQTIFEGQPASLSVAFTSDGPWSFSYRDSTTTAGVTKTVSTTANPYLLEVRPAKTTTYYLTSVSNNCGVGPTKGGLVVVNVTVVLGVEDQSLAEAVSVYPIPATTSLTVHIDGVSASQPALLELTDLAGQTLIRQETRQATSAIQFDQSPAGVYILRIRVGDRMVSKRILKW